MANNHDTHPQLSEELLAAMEVRAQRVGVAAVTWTIGQLERMIAKIEEITAEESGTPVALAEPAPAPVVLIRPRPAAPELMVLQTLLREQYAIKIETPGDWTLQELTTIFQAMEAWRQTTAELGACWGPKSFNAAFGGGVTFIRGGTPPDDTELYEDEVSPHALYCAYTITFYDDCMALLTDPEGELYVRSVVVHELAHCWSQVSWFPFFWNRLQVQMQEQVKDSHYPSAYAQKHGISEDFAESLAATIYPAADPGFLPEFQGSDRNNFIKQKLYLHGRRHR